MSQIILTRAWNVTEHLAIQGGMANYLQAASEENDSALLAAALGEIVRVKGMAQIARDAGVGRESLDKSPSLEDYSESPLFSRSSTGV